MHESGTSAMHCTTQGVMTSIRSAYSRSNPNQLCAAWCMTTNATHDPHSLKVQFSLLSRYPITSGLTEVCEELDIRPISYSPLALGLLADKYTIDR
jgi:aryl-alcohol dehydrogenase-like predicted oxidoreductase